MKINHLVRCELTTEGIVFLAQYLEAIPLPVVLAAFPTIQDMKVAEIAHKMTKDDLMQSGILEECSCCGTTVETSVYQGIMALGTPEIALEGRFVKPREDGSREMLRWVGVKKKNIHTSVTRDESGILCMDVIETEDNEDELTPLDIMYPVLSGILNEMGYQSTLKFTPHTIEESEEIQYRLNRDSSEFLSGADPKFINFITSLDKKSSRGDLSLILQKKAQPTIATTHNIEIYINSSGLGILSFPQKAEKGTVRQFTPLTKQYLKQALEKIMEYTEFDSWFNAYRMG